MRRRISRSASTGSRRGNSGNKRLSVFLGGTGRANPKRGEGSWRDDWRHLRSGMVFGLGQALARSAVAIYTIVLIRLLPEADYGDFAFAFSLAGILITLADGGF